MTPWPRGYRHFPDIDRSSGSLRIRPIHWEDREHIRRWRNAQIDVLRQAEPLSVVEQDRYFLEVVAPQLEMAHPPQILWAFEEDGVLIGYGGLVHIQWADRRAEVSFLTDEARLAPETFTRDWNGFLSLLASTASDALGFHKLTTETYEIRPLVIDILESNGFVREGTHPDHHRVDGRWVASLSHGLLLGSQP